jgi:hypothetical protein
MKKVLFSLLLLLAGHDLLKAQYTAGFENWHTVLGTHTIPDGWNASDSLLKFYGALLNPGATFSPQVQKESPGHAGTGALKVETMTHPGLPTLLPAGVAPCLASNSTVNVNTTTGEFSFLGGTPYTWSPTVASMWVKNNVVSGDSTSITLLVIDNSDGGDSIVCFADTMLGANIPAWTQINLPFYYNPTPGFNSMLIRVIVTSSGNFGFDTTGAFTGCNAGTWVAVDDINVVDPNGVTNLLPGGKHATLFPNPAGEELRLDLNGLVASSLDLYNLRGVCVREFILKGQQPSLNLSDLPAGTYGYVLRGSSGALQQGTVQKK